MSFLAHLPLQQVELPAAPETPRPGDPLGTQAHIVPLGDGAISGTRNMEVSGAAARSQQ